MRFWDTSAIVPLIVEDRHTPAARSLFEEDPGVVLWWAAPVECASAIARRRRDGIISPSEQARALRDLDRLRTDWYEMLPGESVRAQAFRVLRIHPMHAADALQLAAALEWSGMPISGTLVTFDHRLASCAELEGLRVAGVE